MKAYAYELSFVNNDTTYRTIKEIFVPEMNYCFNTDACIFPSNSPRNNNCYETTIDDWTAIFLSNYVKLTETKNDLINKLFNSN